jgi:hypothetical protein
MNGHPISARSTRGRAERQATVALVLLAASALAFGACQENNNPGRVGQADTANNPPTFDGIDAVTEVKATSFVASWLAAEDDVTPSGELTYHIYLANSPGAENLSDPNALTTGVTYREFSGLSEQTQYCVLVRAVDGDDQEDQNEKEVCVVTPDDSDAPSFGGLIAATLTQADPPEITLSWLPAIDDSSAEGNLVYNLYRAGQSGGQDFDAPIGTITGASAYVDTGIERDSIYHYVVRAMDEAGNEESNLIELAASTPYDSAGVVYAYHPGLHDFAQMGAAAALVDWNGDGNLDVVVGAPTTGNPGVGAQAAYRAGQVSVYLGGAAGDFSSDPAVQFYSPNTSANGFFGQALAACDFRGDGSADDLAVGAAGEQRVYLYLNVAGGQDTTPERTITAPSGQGDTDNFGEALACGDINGAGGGDLIVAAPLSDNNGATNSGTLFFYNNNSSPPVIDIAGPNASYYLFPQDDFVAQIPDNNLPYCGESLALDDLDGDGTLDLAVGCPFADTGGSNDGVIVFYSRASLSDADIWTTEGHATAPNLYDGWGWGLAAGNLDDSDPGVELAVGQRYYDSPGTNAGAVFVYDVTYSGGFVLSAPIVTLYDRGPNGSYAGFGAALGVGDADGDGAYDLIVGAPDEDGDAQPANINANLGAFYYFAGNAGAAIDGLPEKEDFATYEQSDGTPVHGGAYNVRFGNAVCVGDIDNDGRDDLLVGSENDSSDGVNTGRVYVWYSVASGEIDLSGPADTWFSAPGLVTSKRFGSSCVVMDYNADGRNDAVIGAQYADDNRPDQGAVYVFLGVASTSTGGSNTGSVPVDGTPDLTVFIPLDTGTNYHYFGSALASCDLTGDGYPELIVGARQFDSALAVSGSTRGSTNEGAAFIFEGGAGGVSDTSYQAVFPTDQDVGLSSYGAAAYSDNHFGYALGCFPASAGSTEMDLVVGAPYAAKPGGNANQGMVAIFQGAANQDPTGGGNSCSGGDEYVGTACLIDDTRDIRIDDQGPYANDDSYFGTSLARGDWDGADGDDLVIGSARARRLAPEPDNNGGAYAFRGGVTGGFIDLSGGVPLAAYSVFDPTGFPNNGFAESAAMGDLNNNGVPELILGVVRCSYNDSVNKARGAYTGCVYVDRGDYRP